MKRHSLDVLSLVFGLVFLLIAGLWSVRRVFEVELPPAGYFFAGALVVAGVLGIVSALRGPRNRQPAETDEAATENTAVGFGHTGGADTEPPRD
ncbi:MAG: hypothetical protein HOV79_30880 [Hamadaea sp.]|nr:hypothetical protein [Hamadaea sp.]